MGQAWTEKDVEQILVNPFSTVTVALALTKEHEPSMSTDAWIEVNTSLISSLGAEFWLMQILNILEGKDGVDAHMNPYNAVNIDPRFAVEHPPIVPRETWVGANAKL